MVEGIPGRHWITLGADKNYGTRDFVRELGELRGTPHVAQHMTGRFSAIDGRMTHHPGYAISQWKRKQVEDIFEWPKTVDLVRRGSAGCSPLQLWCAIWSVCAP